MRKYLSLLFALMIHGCACPGLAQTYLEKQEAPSALNFLKNPGFENGVSAWTRGAGCSTNSSVPLSGLKNGNCTGTGAAETKWEQAPTFAEYRPFVGHTWKASCHVATVSSSMQFCGLFNGSETSCVPVTESASLNVAGYKEYAVPISIPPDQSSSFTAGVRIKTTGSGVFGTRVDNCYLGPWKGVVGLALNTTGWETYTPTVSWTTNTTASALWRRDGPDIKVQFSVSATGAPGSGNLTLSIPSGIVANASKMATGTRQYGGTAYIFDASTGATRVLAAVEPIFPGGTTVQFIASGNSLVSPTVPFTWASGDIIYGEFSLPVVGWAANTVSDVVGLVPKETVYSAYINGSGTVSNEPEDFISGNCSITDTSRFDCNLNASFFSVAPSCTASLAVDDSSTNMSANVIFSSTSQLRIRTLVSNAKAARAFTLICQRAGTDYSSARKSFDNLPFAPMESGSWTPAISSGTNLTTSSVLGGIYMRMGDVVFGSITMDVTAASTTTTSFRFSVPIVPAAGFLSNHQLIGSGGAWNGNMVGNVSSVSGTNFGFYTFAAGTTASRTHNFNFSYRLK